MGMEPLALALGEVQTTLYRSSSAGRSLAARSSNHWEHASIRLPTMVGRQLMNFLWQYVAFIFVTEPWHSRASALRWSVACLARGEPELFEVADAGAALENEVEQVLACQLLDRDALRLE